MKEASTHLQGLSKIVDEIILTGELDRYIMNDGEHSLAHRFPKPATCLVILTAGCGFFMRKLQTSKQGLLCIGTFKLVTQKESAISVNHSD